MTSLDTRVDGDTDSVRTTADGIGTLGGGLDGAGAGFSSALSQSESQWSGSAGDAFRGKVTSAQQATRLAATATRQVHDAMHAFANQMDQVKAKMAQATSIASGAGLSVNGNSIEQPQQPAAPPNACYSPSGAAQMAARFHAAVAKYQRQLAAYRHAEQIIKQARQQEQQAHAALRKENTEAESLFTELKDHKYWIVGDTALSTAERGLGQAEKWAKKADDYTDRFNGLIKDLDTLPEGSEARLAQLRSAGRALEDVINAGDSEDATKVLALGLDPQYSKFLSGAGYVLSAAEIVDDVLHSKDRAQNIAGDVASTAVGAGGTALIGELSVAGAPETFGLSLAVGGVAIGTGYAVKHYGPSAWDWAGKQAGKLESDIEHALNPLNLL
jgi:uncharacterized protein YukE